MGIGFLFYARSLISRVTPSPKKVVFSPSFLVFLCFWGGVFLRFCFYFFVFRALARKNMVFFGRGNEQNREFPLWEHVANFIHPRPPVPAFLTKKR